MLDLSSKTATYATHAADPMYYPLYASNKWVDPLDKYLNDASLTDRDWFNYPDIVKAWQEHKADAIGMSGLLVKSVNVMEENLKELNEQGLAPPVLRRCA